MIEGWSEAAQAGAAPRDAKALAAFAAAFLAARDYAVTPLDAGAMVGQRPGSEPIGVITPPLDADGAATPAAVHAGLAALRAAGATGLAPVLVASKRNFSGADLRSLAEQRAQLLFPLAFADWYFRSNQEAEGDDARGIDARLRKAVGKALGAARAPQSFRRLSGVEAPPAGAPLDGRDLFAPLAESFAAFPTEPRIVVLSGHAGVGKTVLVNELLRDLQARFNDAKIRTGALASRPLLFDPRDLHSQEPETLDDLIDALFATNLSAHVPPRAFAWLLENGFSTWIFDGLDEFYRRQSGFFEALETLLDAPGSQARVIICTRDSLFDSAPALIDFLTRRLARGAGAAELYELARWDAEAKRAFIAVKLGEGGGARAETIAERLESDAALAQLTELPFYCDLFVSALEEGREDALASEFTLMQFAVDALIAREAQKLNLDWDAFVSAEDAERAADLARAAAARGLAPSGENYFADALKAYGQDNLEYLLGGAAHFYGFAATVNRSLSEISIAEWSEVLSPAYIDAELDEEAEGRMILALTQFAFFGRGTASEGGAGGGGAMGFVHELIGEFLAAKYAAALIKSAPEKPEAWRQGLGMRTDLAGTLFARYLSAQLREDPALARHAQAALSAPLLAGAPAGETLAAILKG